MNEFVMALCSTLQSETDWQRGAIAVDQTHMLAPVLSTRLAHAIADVSPTQGTGVQFADGLQKLLSQ